MASAAEKNLAKLLKKKDDYIWSLECDLVRNRMRMARFFKSLRGILGIEHWPQIKGDFDKGVLRILRKAVKKPTLTKTPKSA